MNPDDLCFAFILILHDVLGTKGTFRREHLKSEEFAQIEERMKCLFAMNRAKLFGGNDGDARSQAERITPITAARSAHKPVF